jgi:hypothetical protein
MPAATRMPSGIKRRAETPLRDEISLDIKAQCTVDANLEDKNSRALGQSPSREVGLGCRPSLPGIIEFTEPWRCRVRDARYAGIIVNFSNNYCNFTGLGAI